MRSAAPFRPIFALMLAVAIAAAARGEIIDRIAASVGNRVITATDLDRQIRVSAFQDGVKPDFTTAHKQATLDAMIEQKLIQTELTNSKYPLPDPAELAPAIEQFRKEHFKDEAEYRAALGEFGITEQDFRDLLWWQRTLLLFIEVRFETGVQLGPKDVEEYFTKTVKPAAEAAHPGQTAKLEDYRDQIERKLVGQQADQQMDIWLRDVRRRTDVVLHSAALEALR